MPKRGTRQNLRNFEAISLRLEPSVMVNAELVFGFPASTSLCRLSLDWRGRPSATQDADENNHERKRESHP